ncbi:hypothetical protein [Rhizobium miluonense]|uniref:Uncharacterized protein n=1 Tax=Rhizobium miluonense TaxID=411945 RepID=A0ABU1SMJ0_9HYPH|nr:hypothetical protein [Rhizobium miluonense]MDR6900200.1 hypothetical protein [Rhizobium miluonense]
MENTSMGHRCSRHIAHQEPAAVAVLVAEAGPNWRMSMGALVAKSESAEAAKAGSVVAL